MVSVVKKKFLECDIPSLTLFRCRRKCWKGTPGKPYASKYDEKCFKYISKGMYAKVEIKKEKIKHFKL